MTQLQLDWFNWVIQRIGVAQFSDLMTEWGYNRDDAETLLYAIREDESRIQIIGDLLRDAEDGATDREKMENSGMMSLEEWAPIISENYPLEKATSTTTDAVKTDIWGYIASMFGSATGAASSIWGKDNSAEMIAAYKAQADAASKSQTSIIIIVIVLIIVIALVVVMLNKK